MTLMTDAMVEPPSSFYLRHVGPARLSSYLYACGGDMARACQMYRWDAELAAAFWVDLGHVEVALRNALDERMRARHVGLGLPGSWLDDPRQELGRNRGPRSRHQQPYTDIARARQRVVNNQQPVSVDQIISETSFGLWHQLVSQHQMRLWPDLAGAFPGAPSRDQRIVRDLVAGLRDLRNRIGHHHRVWALPVNTRYADLCRLAGYLDPDLEAWLVEHSTVPVVIGRRP